MVMTATIEAKLVELRKQLQSLVDNANAVQGAIMVCEELLKPSTSVVEPTPSIGHDLP